MLFFVIFGTRGVASDVDSGTFFCPQCRGPRQYDRKRVRRFFTVFFLPVIPLDRLGEYVECTSCRGTFREEVLAHDPDAERRGVQAEFKTAVRDLMVRMLLADGRVEAEEVRTVRDVYGRLVGQPISEADVRADIDRLESDLTDPVKAVRVHGPLLNDHGKELVMRAAYAVAAADGDLDARELSFLDDVGEALGMSPAHIRGLLTEMIQPVQPVQA